MYVPAAFEKLNLSNIVISSIDKTESDMITILIKAPPVNKGSQQQLFHIDVVGSQGVW